MKSPRGRNGLPDRMRCWGTLAISLRTTGGWFCAGTTARASRTFGASLSVRPTTLAASYPSVLPRRASPCATSASGKDRFRTYIARHRPPRLVTAVTATGWYQDSFVLADRTVIGPNQDEVFLQTTYGAADQAYAQAGDLNEWKSHVAAYAIGNHHLALAICTTLSGPLLHLVNEPSGGWQFVGDSRSGKTTILVGAASIGGAPTPAGFLLSWRATGNGLESICTSSL